MKIRVDGLGKKFGKEWIFKDFTYEFISGKKYAVTGRNGSGKSTLLKVLSSAVPASVGKIEYLATDQQTIAVEHIFKHLTYTAPYIELIEEFSLKEFILFYTKFKSLTLSLREFLEELKFIGAKDKLLRNFSSGMKQRLQLGLALFSESDIVFLDEPTSNLDQQNAQWYLDAVSRTTQERLLIISSNQKTEYSFCDEVISIEQYKY